MRPSILLLPLILGACAVVAPSQGALNAATAACSEGDRAACARVPALNAQVQQENTTNALATSTAAAVGGAIVGGALASPYPYYGNSYYGNPYYRPYYNPYYRRCWGCY